MMLRLIENNGFCGLRVSGVIGRGEEDQKEIFTRLTRMARYGHNRRSQVILLIADNVADRY